MKKIMMICVCLVSLAGCGKKGALGAEDQVYPRAYPNPKCITPVC